MKSVLFALVAIIACGGSLPAFAAEHEPSKIRVGYFLEWPTPNLFAQTKQAYDTAMGLEVEWVAFENGNELGLAVASGEVQLGYSLGQVPFIVGVTQGLDLIMIGVAVSYPENDLCVVRDAAGIDRSNAALLEGRKVASVIGNPTHFRLLRMLDHLKVDYRKIELQPVRDGAEALAALQSGEVDMACAYGNALPGMLELGKPLMTGAELEGIGLRMFDAVVVSSAYKNEHPEIVQAFMDVTAASNEQWRKNPEPMRAVIARAARMHQQGSDTTLEGFHFPDVDEQLSEQWMGNSVSRYSKQLADFFVEYGQLEQVLENYDAAVSTRFLR